MESIGRKQRETSEREDTFVEVSAGRLSTCRFSVESFSE